MSFENGSGTIGDWRCRVLAIVDSHLFTELLMSLSRKLIALQA